MNALFHPFEMGAIRLANRIVMPPMGTRFARGDGCAQGLHCLHYASRALGGVGLIMVEATGVENRGRCHPTNLGLYTQEQAASLARVAEAIHRAGAKAGIQLQHGGRKAYPEFGPVAPSSLAFSRDHPVPHALHVGEMEQVTQAFAQAAEGACDAGFDVIELHAAHGYLLHQFLSPHSNQRQDEYGGSVSNRLRFPLQVLADVKAAVPASVPVLMRVSGTEYLEDGYTLEEMLEFASAFRAAGVAALDVSSGGNSPVPPPTGPGYQVEVATRIREHAAVPVIAAGRLGDPSLAQAVVEMGLADLVGIGRGLLDNPHWPLYAARLLGCEEEFYAGAPYLRSLSP